jgi:hypothetical protein
MQKPFVNYYAVYEVNAHHYKLYNNLERMGFKRNDYDLEATIQNGDPLIVSFQSTRNETFDQTAYLNPVLRAEYAEVTGQVTRISLRIQSSAWILVLAGLCVCRLIYNMFTGIVDNAGDMFIFSGVLIGLAIGDIYMRATLLSRFRKWMTKAAALSV